MFVLFWIQNHQINVWQSELTCSSSKNVPHIPDNVVTNETSLHSKVEEDDEMESLPKSWDNMINNDQNIIDTEAQNPNEAVKIFITVLQWPAYK